MGVVSRGVAPGTPAAAVLTGGSFHLAALAVGACALLAANVALGYWDAVAEDSAWRLLGRAFEKWR